MNAPLPPFQPVATSSSSTAAPRVRTQQRKRNADDAAYAGPAPSAAKRSRATDTDGGPTRTAKRRRPSMSLYAGGAPAIPALSSLYAGAEPTAESMVDFTTLATPDLHEYLLRFDLVPAIFPSPLSQLDPPAPSMLLAEDVEDEEETLHLHEHGDDPARVPAPPSPASSRTPTPPVTPATRPRRLTDASITTSSRRRTSRFSDDDASSVGTTKRRRSRARTPILADVGDVNAVLAAIAQRHFQDQHLAEGDAVSGFMAKLKRRPRTRSVDAY